MTMVVKTINPVIVNGQKESSSSKYLSFDGKNTKDVKSFQDWMDVKYPKWVGATNSALNNGKNLNKGRGYGSFGSSTQKAFAKYGEEFKAGAKALFGTLFGSGSENTTPSSTTSATEPSKEEQIAKAKKGEIWDKAKGWIKSDKAKDALAFLQSSGGIKGLLGGIFGGSSSNQGTGFPQTTSEGSFGSGLPAEIPEKKGLSTGAKIGIGVGVAVLLGVIIYAVTRPKTGK